MTEERKPKRFLHPVEGCYEHADGTFSDEEYWAEDMTVESHERFLEINREIREFEKTTAKMPPDQLEESRRKLQDPVLLKTLEELYDKSVKQGNAYPYEYAWAWFWCFYTRDKEGRIVKIDPPEE